MKEEKILFKSEVSLEDLGMRIEEGQDERAKGI